MSLYFNSDRIGIDPGTDLVTEKKDIALTRWMPISTVNPDFEKAAIDSFDGTRGVCIKQNSLTLSNQTAMWLGDGDYFAYSAAGPAVGVVHVSHLGDDARFVVLGAAVDKNRLNGDSWRMFAVPVTSLGVPAATTIATEVDEEG